MVKYGIAPVMLDIWIVKVVCFWLERVVKQIIKYDNKTYYPFLIEYFLKSIPGVIIGTLILRNEELIAAVQINQESDASIISPIILKFLPKATIKYLKEMPNGSSTSFKD